MNLVGKIIKIRAVEWDDLIFLQDLINDPAIESQTIDTHFPQSKKAQEKWFEGFNCQEEMRCIIVNAENKTQIGYVSVTEIDYKNQSAVVGIKMDTNSRNRIKGDMDEVFSLMKNFCFNEIHLQRLEAYAFFDNAFSIKNLQSHGFVQEGRLRRKCFKNGEWKDVLIFSLLKE